MYRYILLLFLLASSTANAQNSASNEYENAPVWKKDVSRMIPLTDSGDYDAKGLFMRNLLKAIKTGEVTAYSNTDHDLKTPVDYNTIMSLYGRARHNGSKQVRKAGKHSEIADYAGLKILERWRFDPATGKTEIEIRGVAPTCDIYNPDGSYRLSRPLFWLKYQDIKNIIIHTRPLYVAPNGIMLRIYRDQKSFSHIIDMAETDDTAKHHVQDDSPDSTLFEIMVASVNTNKINAYNADDANCTHPLTNKEFNRFFTGRTDTVEVEDPISKKRVLQIIKGRYEYGAIHLYKIIDDWQPDFNTGITLIQTKAIQPIADEHATETPEKLFFKVKYEDLQKISSGYNQYHPLDNISAYIWNSYFK